MKRKLRKDRLILLGGGVIALVILVLGTFFFIKSNNTTIVLNGEKDISLEVFDDYVELDAKLLYKGSEKKIIKATVSNVDTSVLGDYTVAYKYNSFLLKKDVKRHVKVVDTTAPKLTLKGSDMTLKLNQSYIEPGYSAIDNYDGDISDKVEVEGKVDTSKLGTYEVTYSITDSSGNKSTVERKVVISQVAKPTPSKGPSAGVIYLTFDDGPHVTNTDKILDILKSEGVKATFFVVGVGPDRVIKRAYDEGHELALHTYSHKYDEIYKNEDAYYRDLYKIQSRVKNITGHTTMLMRFPGGASNNISRKINKGIMTRLTKDIQAKGFKYFDWNVDSGDASYNVDGKFVYNNTIKQLSKTRSNVILMHDIHSHTVDALRDIIQYGKNNGYTFEVLSQLKGTVHHSVNN